MTECIRVGFGEVGSKVGAASAMAPTRRIFSLYDGSR